MVVRYGSGEAWQKATTLDWIKRIKGAVPADAKVLFEGQTRIAFVKDALLQTGINVAEIVLVDCSDDVRRERLHGERNQPDLANAQMMDWARYLRSEANDAGCRILDTTGESLQGSVERVLQIINE